MLAYRVTGDVKEIARKLSGVGKEQVPFAAALALTRTAKFIEAKLYEEMPRVFDRPTRATLSSLVVQPATKKSLYSEVRVRDFSSKARAAANKWLAPQIRGGARQHKPFESLLIRAGKMPPGTFLVPTKLAPRDAYGNVPRGELVRLLSDLRAHFDTALNMTAKSKKRRLRQRKKLPVFYFSTYPPNPRTAHLAPGIYLRTHLGFGTAIKPVFLFVSRARYRPRLRFYEIAERVGHMRWRIEFPLAMRQALATAFAP